MSCNALLDGLMQKRHNSIAFVMELRLFYIKLHKYNEYLFPSISSRYNSRLYDYMFSNVSKKIPHT